MELGFMDTSTQSLLSIPINCRTLYPKEYFDDLSL